MSVTIYDIAKKCNCSTTTVSKVLNHTGKISKKTADMIRKTAEEMGYTPKPSARFIAGGAKFSHLIGVILEINEDKSIGHELFSKILNSFRIEAEKSDYDICFISKVNSASNLSYLQKIESRGCSGVFCLSAIDKSARVKELEEAHIPVAAFDYNQAKLSISSNNKEATIALVDHLAKLGHKRIVFVSPDDSEVCTLRRQGFIEGLAKNNIPFDERMIVRAPFFSETGPKLATDKAFASGIEPTAIMYPDDYSAINAIPYLRTLGYKVSRDISITGFDGIEVARIMRPSITTITQDPKQIGREAARMLLNEIEGKNNEPIHLTIPAFLSEGESTAELEEK